MQRPEDVAEARELVGGRALLLTKIEKPQALEQLDEILRLSDAVMVARGDLGVELPPEDVPLVQKRADPRRPPLGQARRRRDPDDGEHDRGRRPDAGRGFRRGDPRCSTAPTP